LPRAVSPQKLTVSGATSLAYYKFNGFATNRSWYYLPS